MKLAYSVQLNLTFRCSGGFPALVVHYLTDHFTTFELENPSYDLSKLQIQTRSTGSKIMKGPVGYFLYIYPRHNARYDAKL